MGKNSNTISDGTKHNPKTELTHFGCLAMEECSLGVQAVSEPFTSQKNIFLFGHFWHVSRKCHRVPMSHACPTRRHPPSQACMCIRGSNQSSFGQVRTILQSSNSILHNILRSTSIYKKLRKNWKTSKLWNATFYEGLNTKRWKAKKKKNSMLQKWKYYDRWVNTQDKINHKRKHYGVSLEARTVGMIVVSFKVIWPWVEKTHKSISTDSISNGR